MHNIMKQRKWRIASIIVILVILSWGVFHTAPKQKDISESEVFSREQVEAAMKETIENLDAADYEALQANANSEMQTVLNEETIKPAKEQIAPSWGERQSYGEMSITEVTKDEMLYVVGEVTVTYGQVSVMYRLTYNQDMLLAGLYMK